MGKVEGFIAAAIAVLGFGSNFIPCKSYDMGDGMFFNMIMCLGIWLLGVGYEIVQFPSTSEFHPFALLGGLIWCTGNILTVPIIKCLGLALGVAIWGATALFVGWLTGKFGLLGTPKDHSVKNEVLNYIGVVVVIFAIICFMFVKPVRDNKSATSSLNSSLQNERDNPLLNEDGFDPQRIESRSKLKQNQPLPISAMMHNINQVNRSWVDDLTSRQKQMVGAILSIIAGTCYGLCFCPIQHLIHGVHHSDKSDWSNNLEDYAFCHYSGILISSILYFIIYCGYTKNNPQVNTKGILPAIISGIVWSIAQTAFFTADDSDNLGTDTSFPIISSMPQVVASLWGVFLFKEIQGKRNLIMLCIAIFVNIAGVGFIALSKF